MADIEKTLSLAEGKSKLEAMDKKLPVLSEKETEQAKTAGVERTDASGRTTVPKFEL